MRTILPVILVAGGLWGASPARAFELQAPAFDGASGSVDRRSASPVPGFVYGEGAREGAEMWKIGGDLTLAGLNTTVFATVAFVVLGRVPFFVTLPGQSQRRPLPELSWRLAVTGVVMVVTGLGVMGVAVLRTAVGDAADAAWLSRRDDDALAPASVRPKLVVAGVVEVDDPFSG